MKNYKDYTIKKADVFNDKLNGFKDIINSNNRFGFR